MECQKCQNCQRGFEKNWILCCVRNVTDARVGLEKIGMPEVSELTEKILKKNEFRVVSEVSQMPEELDIDLKMYKP